MTLDDRTGVVLAGQTLTGVDVDGVEWRTVTMDGWAGSPASTLAPIQKPRQPGAFVTGPRQLAPRPLGLGGFVTAPSPSALRDALDRLNAAAALDGAALDVTEGDATRHCQVYRQGEVATSWLTDTVAQWSLDLLAPDPRKYGDPIVIATGLPSSSGGLTWPVTWPILWSGVTTSGVIHIDNPGNIPSPVTLRIDGPVTGPSVRHVAQGRELTVASSYTLGAGSWLDVDMERRTVLEAGTASRNGFITERGWFSLDPGANDIIFGAQSFDASALLTLTVSPAYL